MGGFLWCQNGECTLTSACVNTSACASTGLALAYAVLVLRRRSGGGGGVFRLRGFGPAAHRVELLLLVFTA